MSYSDRFIPSRASSNLDGYSGGNENNQPAGGSSGASGAGSEQREDGGYTQLLRSEMLGQQTHASGSGGMPVDGSPGGSSPGGSSRRSSYIRTPGTPLASPGNSNMLRYRIEGVSPESPFSLSPFPLGSSLSTPRRSPRKIARSPFKVLDAPALQDDFYLNLVDWSLNNTLAVGLGTCVYLWSACTSKVTKLCDLGPNDSVCSVAWTQRGSYLAVGTNLGMVQIWDPPKNKQVRCMAGHKTRVGTLAWASSTLSSGSRDRSILQRDIRAPEDSILQLLGHKSEVCGLKWSYDDRELASGGNDNNLFIWNNTSTSPVLRFSDHTAAVKAIAWSPHQHGLLASGGGTADRCIRFWNTATNSALQCVDTGSQVCNLVWSKNVNELVSTHGYSQNQIIVWRYPSMTKLATLTGHTLRVLYLAISPDGQTIVTGAGDETLRFWNVFPGPKSQNSGHDSSTWGLGHTVVR
mmetsp:Transcript_12295/g.44836  ORF Transcript_12295/g.44836 Transcript_12295/m.44836 type:complete len:464 (+) Transcript_12295:200-1591(+)